MARRDANKSHKGSKKKGSGFSLSGVLDMASAGKESLDAMDAEVRIRVHVGSGCERAIVLAAKEALLAERTGGVVEVVGIDAPAASSADPDAVVVLGGVGEPGAAALIRFYLACEVPCAFVSASALDAPDLSGSAAAEGLYEALGVSEPAALAPRLATWLAGVVENRVALAANFAFCRAAVSARLTAACAAENAALGAIAFIPGSDFPIMTASQVKLALDIAAAHGAGLEPGRALEVAGVVGAGLAYRGVARGVAGLVPGFGWLLKAGMGYAGTVATGRAVQARFEGLGPHASKGTGADSCAAPAVAALPIASAEGAAKPRGASRPFPGFPRPPRKDREDGPKGRSEAQGAGACGPDAGYLVIDGRGGAHEG